MKLPLLAAAALRTTTWSVTSLTRTCSDAAASCLWSFTIAPSDGAPVPCSLHTAGSRDQHAGPAACGPWTVFSGWSDQFGAGGGFTTISVVDYEHSLIIYPAYRDEDVAGGRMPADAVYTPLPLP